MRYTIAITEEEKDGKSSYSASVLELPDLQGHGSSINKAVKDIREKIKGRTESFHDDAVFSTVNSKKPKDPKDPKDPDYFYTLNDKRDSKCETFKRVICLLLGVTSIFAIPLIILYFYYHPTIKGMAGIIINIAGIDNITNDGKKHILPYVLEASASIASILAVIWAVQSYWRLRYIDKQAEKWQPHKNSRDWSSPFTFHALAESHKEWAELWFCWCVAIFLCGLTYAIFNVYHKPITVCTDFNSAWCAISNIISAHAPSSFIYLLFGVAWYWASKQYRSHWHNFVINAYRHRALYRFEQLRDEIQDNINDYGSLESKSKAKDTILELYRLSGVLLLIPGDSSYLEKAASEDVSKAILQMEEIAKAFTGSTAKRD